MILNDFINKYVTKRNDSMFRIDIESHNEELEKAIAGKSILVIGGAGCIGSSFIKAVLNYHPGALYIVDINENALAELIRDLRSTNGLYLPDEFVSYPMDYCSTTFGRMFRKHCGFDIIGNFSAHKHVRSEKDIYSVEALLRNNVINAKKLLDLLVEYPPSVYFCVSTDKAVNPVNIMGASKRIMEDLIFSYSEIFPVKTARFANVAFSNGSLPAGFIARMEKMQPISAPSDVKRYFVSPTESGQICMLSAILGENREIFFPKLEEEQMMTFDSIAMDLLKEHGYDVLQCSSEQEAKEKAEALKDGSRKYPVYFSRSNTSGEKAFEEFYTKFESVDNGRFLSLGVIVDKTAPSRIAVEELVKQLDAIFEKDNITKETIIALIKSYLPNFEHIEMGKSLDGKM